jgi:hypothetical protein
MLILALGALWFAVQEKNRADRAAARAREEWAFSLQQKSQAADAARDAQLAAKQAQEKSQVALQDAPRITCR